MTTFEAKIDALTDSVTRLSERIDAINGHMQRQTLENLPSADQINELIATLNSRNPVRSAAAAAAVGSDAESKGAVAESGPAR